MHQPEKEGFAREELVSLQLENLRRTVARIRDNNPDYHARIGHVDPGDIHAVDACSSVSARCEMRSNTSKGANVFSMISSI